MSVFSHFRQVPRYAVFLAAIWSPAWSQIALVHVTSCPVGILPGSGCLIPVSGPGNLLVVGVRMVGTTATVTAIVDNAQNQYSQAAGSRAIDTTSASSIEIWYARNTTAGATMVFIAPSASVAGAAVIWEFSGLDTASPFDQAAALSNQSPAISVSAPALAGPPNEVLISVSATQNNLLGGVSGGFTNDSSLFGGGWAHLITSAAGSYSPAWAASSAGTYASSTASFKGLTTSCDVNGDGVVNAADVQLLTNMEVHAPGFFCTANVGGVLGCTDAARRVVIKAALVQGCHFITLNWTPSPSTGVVGYNVYRGTSPGTESQTPLNTSGPVNDTTFTDVGTTSGTTYYYIVKSTDGTSLSPPSQEVSGLAF